MGDVPLPQYSPASHDTFFPFVLLCVNVLKMQEI